MKKLFAFLFIMAVAVSGKAQQTGSLSTVNCPTAGCGTSTYNMFNLDSTVGRQAFYFSPADGTFHIPKLFVTSFSLGITGSTQCLQVNTAGAVSGTGSACGSGSMVYPGAGVPVSTGSAWGTSITQANIPLLNASNIFTGSLQTMPNLYASATAEFGALVGSSHQVVINPAVAIVGYNSSDVPMYSFSNIDGTSLIAGPLTVPSVKVTGPGIPIATGTASNTDLAGQITLATGSGNYTFTSTHVTAPIVVCTDTTALLPVQCSASTTAITITGTGSDVINYIVIGRT